MDFSTIDEIQRLKSDAWSLFAITIDILGFPTIEYLILNIVSKALVDKLMYERDFVMVPLKEINNKL